MKPALDSLQQTLTILRPEKWKTKADVSQTTVANINSIRIDLQTTLPPLLATADQHSDSVVAVLPAFRNVVLLYDVVLRVAQVAAIAAPNPQSTALQQTITTLDTSRRKLGDDLQTSSEAQNRQVDDLQSQLRTIKAIPLPVPVVCPTPPPPVTKPKAKSHAKPKPAAAPAPTP